MEPPLRNRTPEPKSERGKCRRLKVSRRRDATRAIPCRIGAVFRFWSGGQRGSFRDPGKLETSGHRPGKEAVLRAGHIRLEWMCFFLLTLTLVSNFAISNQVPWCGTVPERPQTRLCRVVTGCRYDDTDLQIGECDKGVLVAPSWINGRLYRYRLGNRQRCTIDGRMQG